MAYPGDTSRFGDAELADLGRQGPNDFFNGLLGVCVTQDCATDFQALS